VKTLRYGQLMIMTDQDHDGSHIKGLLINFLHAHFPSLLKIPNFLVEFITPIIKATKGNKRMVFHTLPECAALPARPRPRRQAISPAAPRVCARQV